MLENIYEHNIIEDIGIAFIENLETKCHYCT